MRFYGTLDVIEFKGREYTETLRDYVSRAMYRAARAFLYAASKQVPVRSGMAKGSFLRLGELVNTSITIQPRTTNERYYINRYQTIPKTPQSGYERSSAILNWDGNRFIFRFDANIFHYKLLDVYGIRGQGPWNSFVLGRAAFYQSLQESKRLRPDIKSFMVRTRITYGRGRRPTRQLPTRLTRQRRSF